MVCEGERTEPLYFHALKDRLRLRTLDVKGTGDDPRTLVDFAKRLRDEEERRGDGFDFVYCVFDRDMHPAFKEASDVAQRSGIGLARSWPCFEFWLLLHFEYSRKAYARRGRRSACDACIQDLRRHIPNYSKGDRAYLDGLWDHLDAAIDRARRVLEDAKGTEARTRPLKYTGSWSICEHWPEHLAPEAWARNLVEFKQPVAVSYAPAPE